MRDTDIVDTPVTEVMSDRVGAVLSSCPVVDAVDTILGTGLRHLAVVGSDGKCLGVVSAESVALRMTKVSMPMETVADLLPDAFTAISAEASIGEAAGLMLTGLVDALCVVDDDRRPLGVVAWTDIRRARSDG